MIKLKPCPFCGCTDVDVVDEGDFSFIECSGCLGAFYQREACSVEDNVEAWNKRTLKEQEAVKPYMDYDGHDVWRCGKCGATIFHIFHDESDEDRKSYAKFCRHCGLKVKWE